MQTTDLAQTAGTSPPDQFATVYPKHRELMHARGIDDSVIDESGCFSLTPPDGVERLRELGFKSLADVGFGLVLPIHAPKGGVFGIETYIVRPDTPVVRNGKAAKYVNARKEEARTFFDVHPRYADRLQSPEPLWITEGPLKGWAATSKGLLCIALCGVAMWQTDGDALPEWKHVQLKGRDVYIAFDSDVLTNDAVQNQLEALDRYLTGWGAKVHRVILPAGPDGQKVGLDDYLVSHTVEDLYALAGSATAASKIDWTFLAALNSKHAYMTDLHYYIEETKDNFGFATTIAHTLPELKNRYASQGRKFGNRERNIVDVWNADKSRRTYRNFDLRPSKTQAECEADGVYNLFQGWNIEPIDPKSLPSNRACKLILEHIRKRLANGDEAIADAILDLLAYHVQFPEEKVRVALVLRGKTQGAGRNFLFNYLRRIYGAHAVRVDDKRGIVGQFNAHLAGSLLVFVDEATFGGDVQAAQRLKTLISEDTMPLERKGKDVAFVRNCAMLIIAGNSDNLVHVEIGDRRNFVVDCIEEKMPAADVAALKAEMLTESGPGAFLYYLQHRELPKDYDHTNVPDTDARTEAKIQNLPTIEQFFLQFLNAGVVSFKNESGHVQRMYWPVEEGALRKDDLFAAYAQNAQGRKFERPANAVWFYRSLRKGNARSVPLVLRNERPQQADGSRPVLAIVPGLIEARSIFATACTLGENAWNDAVSVEEQAAAIAATDSMGY